MFSYFAVAAISYALGAFSHKWAAAYFKSTTGLDAQAVANKAVDAVKKV